jgi:hypothetical protein
MPSIATPRLTEEQATAVRRWKIGHHTFHLQLVAINSVLEDAFAALRDCDWPRLAGRLRELRLLYDAATVSMKYAGSFERDTYATFIRPSMDEQYVGAGFSGRFNREHAVMLSGLKQLKSEVRLALDVESEPAGVRAASDELWSAQARNRRNHMFVCQRFVPDGVSLLRQYFRKTGGRPASPLGPAGLDRCNPPTER